MAGAIISAVMLPASELRGTKKYGKMLGSSLLRDIRIVSGEKIVPGQIAEKYESGSVPETKLNVHVIIDVVGEKDFVTDNLPVWSVGKVGVT